MSNINYNAIIRDINEALEGNKLRGIKGGRYEEAAELAAKELGFTIESTFSKHGKHFIDDKYNRDIYKVKIKRGKRSFTIEFGQSLNKSMNNRVRPTYYDVISCVQKYEVGSFENFCSDFGYDTDSRRAKKIYKAVCKEYNNMARLFNDEELEILSLIN